MSAGGGASGLFGLLHKDLAIGGVPGRDPVAPPELARDAPGLDVPQPLEVGLLPVARRDDRAALLHRLQRRLGQGGGVHVPLVGQVGLYDDQLGLLVVGQHQAVVLDSVEQAQGLQVGDHALAGHEAVEAAIGLGDLVVHPRIGGEDVDRRQALALGHLEVVEVVGGRDLHRPGALLGVGVLVAHDGDQTAGERQSDLAADQGLVALILGMDRHGSVAEHGLWPRGGDHDVLVVGPIDGIAQAPHVTLDLDVLDLQVRDRGLQFRMPVHQPLVAIDQALLVQGDEHLAHRCREARIQGEALAAPVAGSAEAPQLAHDGAAGLRLPGPDLLQERLAAHLAAADVALLGQLALHHHLGGDAGVVGARQPQGGLAAHALEPGEHVLQRVVQGMADVQRAGDVRRRDDDAEGCSGGIGHRRKGARRLPLLIEARLDGAGIKGLFQHGPCPLSQREREGPTATRWEGEGFRALRTGLRAKAQAWGINPQTSPGCSAAPFLRRPSSWALG